MSRYHRPSEAEMQELAERIELGLIDGQAAAAAEYSDVDVYEELEQVPVESLVENRRRSDAFDVVPYRPGDEENPHNAWITRFSLSRPGADGLLSDRTVAVKDNLCVRGVEMTNASRGFEGFVPGEHATTVERLLDAGARILGKTNMDEMAMGPTSESSAFGPPTNPVDEEHVAGGSSGGSGAVVAAGDVDLALGSDTGGSVRIPASYCGVVGMKPTHGRVSKRGFSTQGDSLDEIGPMAVDVETTARGLEAIADPLPRVGRESFTEALGTDLSSVTIGVVDRYLNDFAVDAVREVVEAAVDDLEGFGATVRTIEIPELAHTGAAWWGIGPVEFAAAYATNDIGLWRHRAGIPSLAEGFDRVRKASSENIGTVPKEVLLLGAHLLYNHGGYHYVRAQNLRVALKAAVDDALEDVDVLVTPSTPTTALELGAFGSEEMPSPNDSLAPANVTGHPALSIPCGDVDDLPVGLQLIGPWYGEKNLFDIAYTYEQNA